MNDIIISLVQKDWSRVNFDFDSVHYSICLVLPKESWPNCFWLQMLQFCLFLLCLGSILTNLKIIVVCQNVGGLSILFYVSCDFRQSSEEAAQSGVLKTGSRTVWMKY